MTSNSESRFSTNRERCDHPSCPQRPPGTPRHELESGPEVHDECRELPFPVSPADDEREAEMKDKDYLRGYIQGVQDLERLGHSSPSAEKHAQVLVEEGFRRDRHRGPITDEEVEAAGKRLWYMDYGYIQEWESETVTEKLRHQYRIRGRAALEAAEAARVNQADRGQR